MVGGKRYPANQGGLVDVESDRFIIQCKERRSLSLEELTQLAEQMQEVGSEKGKIGLVAAKVRRGSGRKSPALIVLTEDQWPSVMELLQDLQKGTTA